MSGGPKSSSAPIAFGSGAASDQLAKAAPTHLLKRRIGGFGLGDQYADDCLQGVDGVVAGRGRLHTALHQEASSAALISPENEHLPQGKVARYRSRTDWTEERLTILADFFEAGWSHELMAQALGVSKGAISGKLDRLAEANPKKWTRSATIIAIRPDRSAHAARAEERRAQLAMTQAIEESVVGVILQQLGPHMCRWPMAFASERTFCGADQVVGSSYCGEHHGRSRLRGHIA